MTWKHLFVADDGEEKQEGRRGGRQRGWRGRETRMLMRVRRRKEEGRENIDLRQEKRRECDTEGPRTARTLIRSVEGNKTVVDGSGCPADLCGFSTCVSAGEGGGGHAKGERKDAVSRHFQGCRGGTDGKGGRCIEDGCSGRRYSGNAVAVG